jgi:hypothetical protein
MPHIADVIFYSLPLEIWVQIASYVTLEDYWHFMEALHAEKGRLTGWHGYRFSFHMRHDYTMIGEPPRSAWDVVTQPPHRGQWPEVNVLGAYLEQGQPDYRNPIRFVRPLRRVECTDELELLSLCTFWTHGSNDVSEAREMFHRGVMSADLAKYKKVERLVLCHVLAIRVRVPETVKYLWVYSCNIAELEIPHTLYGYEGHGHLQVGRRIYDATRVSACETREEAEQWTMPNYCSRGSHEIKKFVGEFCLLPWMPALPAASVVSHIDTAYGARLTRVGELWIQCDYDAIVPHDVLIIGYSGGHWPSLISLCRENASGDFGGRLARVCGVEYLKATERQELAAILGALYERVLWMSD